MFSSGHLKYSSKNKLALIIFVITNIMNVYFIFFVSDNTELHSGCLMKEYQYTSYNLWYIYLFLSISSIYILLKHRLELIIIYILSISLPLSASPLITNIICSSEYTNKATILAANILYGFTNPTITIGVFLFFLIYLTVSVLHNRALWLINLSLLSIVILFLHTIIVYWGVVIEG